MLIIFYRKTFQLTLPTLHTNVIAYRWYEIELGSIYSFKIMNNQCIFL